MKTTNQFIACTIALIYGAKGMHVQEIYEDKDGSLNQLIEETSVINLSEASGDCETCKRLECKGLNCPSV